MRLCFSGLGGPVDVDSSAVTVLEVHPRVLFCRICSSLLSEAGEDAVEPYTLWVDEEKELKPSGQWLYIGNPLCLPWEHRALAGALTGKVEKLLMEEEGVRRDIEDTFAGLTAKLSQLVLQLDSDYSFGVDWELKRYLKSFGFGVDIAEDEMLLDKLIKFLMMAKDVGCEKLLVFVNLKLFLSEKELSRFYEQVFFSKRSVMLIENTPDSTCRAGERKYIIDQDLLEFWPQD